MARNAGDVGVKKAGLDVLSLFALSVLVGAFIAVGAIFSTTVSAGGLLIRDAGGSTSLTGSIPT